MTLYVAVADLGEAPPPPLFLNQTEAQRAKKCFFGRPPLPPPLVISRSRTGTV